MDLKVISLNLWTGGRLMPAILQFLKQEAADIVLLQEVYNGSDAGLTDNYRSMETLKQLDYPYSQFAQAYIEDKDSYQLPHGNAVLSKLSLKVHGSTIMKVIEQASYKDVPEQWPFLPALLQHVEIEDQGLHIFNLHGPWDLDGDNYGSRRQVMSQTILEAVKDKDKVIIAGDTNAKMSNQAMRNLEPVLKPAFDSRLRSTFNMRRKDNPGYASAAVDLMYVSPQLEVLEASYPDIDISDHLPIVARVRVS